MPAKSGNREGRREAAALLLAAGRTIRAAAQRANIGERTLRGWLTDQSYQACILEIRSELFSRAVGALCSLTTRAGRTLGKLLGSEDEKIQLGAARAILEATPRLREAGELVNRLAALEEKLAGAKR